MFHGRTLIRAALFTLLFTPLADAVQAAVCVGPPMPGAMAIGPAVPVTVYANRWNLIGIPAYSPVNFSPTAYADLCVSLALPPGALIVQIDSESGLTQSHLCGQISTLTFLSCNGIAVWSDVTTAGFLATGAGVEGAWDYPVYGDGPGPVGDQLYGVPYTIADTDPEELCSDLGLPSGTMIVSSDAGGGTWKYHTCGQIPVYTLTPGEAVMILAPGPAGGLVSVGFADIF